MRPLKSGAVSPAPLKNAPRRSPAWRGLFSPAGNGGLLLALGILLAAAPLYADDAVEVGAAQEGSQATVDSANSQAGDDDGRDADGSAVDGAGDAARLPDPILLAQAKLSELEPLEPLDSDMDMRPRFDTELPQMPTGHDDLIAYIAEGYDNPEMTLSLDAAIAMALEHNHGLNSQRLRAAAATKDKQIVWADLKPQVGLRSSLFQQWSFDRETTALPGGGTTSSNNTGDLTFNVALEVTKRIYDWGLSSHQIDAAEARHAIQYYTTGIAEDQLISDVIVAYYSYNLALGQLRVRRDELDLSVEFLRIAEIQFEVGTVPRLDVIRAEARVEQARDALIQAQATLGNSAALFFSLLGVEDQRYVPAVITPELVDLGSEPIELQSAIDTALVKRPEVELQYQTLFAGEVSKELAKNRPLLGAYAQGQLQTPNSTQVGHQSYELGLELVWQISNGGKDRRLREQAEISLLSIEEAIHNLEAQIELDTTTAWNGAVANRGSAEAARKNLELTAEALRAANVGYRAGVTPYIEFESALNANIAAAINYLTALVNVKLAQSDLERAQGYPLIDAVEDANAESAGMRRLPDTSRLHQRVEGENVVAAESGDAGSSATVDAEIAVESENETTESADSTGGNSESWADAAGSESETQG